MTTIHGSCLCASIKYCIEGPVNLFQYCFCSRCRKNTGSAHASNLFAPVEQFSWLQGQELLGHYQLPEAKYFSTGFCKTCGSSMPWLTRNQKNYVVPAGSLDDELELTPQQSIFWQSRANWYQLPSDIPCFAELPAKK